MAVFVGMLIASAVGFILTKRISRLEKYSYIPKIAAAFAFLGIIALYTSTSQISNGRVAKNESGEGSAEYYFDITVPGLMKDEEFSFELKERQLDDTQVQSALAAAQKELSKVMLKDNKSADYVTKDLYLPKSLQDGKVTAAYEFSDMNLVEDDGSIIFENTTKEGQIITLEVILTCQETEKIIKYPLRIVEDSTDKKALFLKYLKKTIESRENQSPNAKTITLPKELGSLPIEWKDSGAVNPWHILFFLIIVVVAVEFAKRADIKKKEKDKRDMLMSEYPEFISEISLLLGTGMNVKTAIERMVMQKEKNNEKLTPLGEELKLTCGEIKGGISEASAYERFAQRTGLRAYRKFCGMLIQNLKKGSKKMRQLLDMEAAMSMEEQKALARKKGEEAGTKLLLPMMIMLALVLVIIMYPAMGSMDMF